MEMFNVHRRDILNFDNYMDLKKPGFGGPKSAKVYRDASGKKVNSNPKLEGYQRVVQRDSAFSHNVYDPTYKAMTHDLVYKQEKKKPFTYDPYSTALPVKEVGAVKEGRSCRSFSEFLNEAEGAEMRIPARSFDMAEDILFDKKIDWDGFANTPRGINGKAFTKGGEMVAYFDNDTKELVMLPNATEMTMPAEMDSYTEEEYPEDEYMDDAEVRETPEEEDLEIDEPEIENLLTSKKSKEIKEIEDLLTSFEDSSPEYDEDEF
jgi:hypothetical protein